MSSNDALDIETFPNLFGVIAQHPSHAAALGILVAQWALAEGALSSCLRWMLQTDRKTAETIYLNFSSTRSKIDLLLRLNRTHSPDKGSFRAIKSVLMDGYTINSIRNRYIHAEWAASADMPGKLQRRQLMLPQASSKKHEHEPVWLSPDDITHDTRKIMLWTMKLKMALHKADPARLNTRREPLPLHDED